jgi:hypothetical protein
MDHIEPVFFADAKVKKITWKPLEGGSVAMSFTVSVLLDEDEAAELLSAWIRGEVRLTLTPPSAAPQQEDLAA